MVIYADDYGLPFESIPSELAANGAQDLLSAGVAITKDLESPVTSQERLVLAYSIGLGNTWRR